MSFFKWIGGMNKGPPTGGAPGNSLYSEERYYGFENFGNTCYCNSVLQVLYFCKPFRDCVLCYTFPESAGQLAAKTEQLDLSHLDALHQGSFRPAAGKESLLSDSSTSHSNYSRADSPLATGNIDSLLQPSPLVLPPQYTSTSGSTTASTHLSALTVPSALPSTQSGQLLSATSPSISTAVSPSITSSTVPPAPAATTGLGSSLNGGPTIPTRSIWSGSHISSVLEKITFNEDMDNTMLHAMQELFSAISSQKKQSGVFSPRQFISKLKEENELFNNSMQQDAHEMFNYLLNDISDILLKQKREVTAALKKLLIPTLSNSNADPLFPTTWVHSLFEGQLTNETKCLNCESITNRVEAFLDLSIDIDQYSSISSCLRNFSSSELNFTDTNATPPPRMKIKRLPNILAIHLKRFKFQEQLGRYSKLSYQVSFPLELRLFNTADGAENSDRLYELHGVVVHIGSGPQSGHYVSLIKSENQWMLFDDDDVSIVDEADLFQYFGDSSSLGTGYFYIFTAVDFDSTTVLRTIMPETWLHANEKAAGANSNEVEDLPNPIGLADTKSHDTSVTPHILASQELAKDEEIGIGGSTPESQTTELTTGGTGMDSFQRALQSQLVNQIEQQVKLHHRSSSGGALSTEDGTTSNLPIRFSRKLGVGNFIGGSSQTKRPSLPVLHFDSGNREDLGVNGSGVPNTADAQSGSQSSSAGGPVGAAGKDGSWGWFSSIRRDKSINKANPI
ncbi:hypothetical protein BASA62_009209 [Batrachochytrium salamandrivorans]|nr:hypothetical protein BASA62_009209 [Batrachochytrium salamandrivorans]